MKKIVEYDVAMTTDSLQDLSKKVNFLIGNGWQPLGEVKLLKMMFQEVYNCDVLIQAMVKYEEDKTCPGCGAVYLEKPCCAQMAEKKVCRDHGQTGVCECYIKNRERYGLFSD